MPSRQGTQRSPTFRARSLAIVIATIVAGCANVEPGPMPGAWEHASNPDGGPGSDADATTDANVDANVGHCDPYDDGYDYLTCNCHTYANREVDEHTGIVICGGTPDADNPYENPGHHTFVYRQVCETEVTQCCSPSAGCTSTEGATTCWVEYWNYGEMCEGGEVPEEGGLPPDIDEDPDQDCVEDFCGDQYGGDDERVLPPGETVEWPGPGICVEHFDGEDEVDECLDCCDWRANLWNHVDDPPTEEEREDFVCRCRAQCNGDDPAEQCDEPPPDGGTDGGPGGDAGV